MLPGLVLTGLCLPCLSEDGENLVACLACWPHRCRRPEFSSLTVHHDHLVQDTCHNHDLHAMMETTVHHWDY